MRLRLPRLLAEGATLLGGNALAQAIAFAAYFVVTRLYSPDEMGVYNLLFSYVEVLIILSTLKYEMAVVAAPTLGEAQAVAGFALWLNTRVSAVILVAVMVIGSFSPSVGELGWLVLVVPLMVMLCGTSRVYTALFNRARDYRTLAVSSTLESAATAVAKVGLALPGWTQVGLPCGTVVGRAVSNVWLRLRLRRRLPGFRVRLFSRRATLRQRAAARRNGNFPRFVAVKDLINSLSEALPVLLLAPHFDAAFIGLYGLAYAMGKTPANLVSNSAESVLYAHASECVRQRRPLGSLVRRYLLLMAVAASVAVAAAYLLADPFFSFGFGSRWAGCAPFLKVMLPWLWIHVVATPLTFVANLFSTQFAELCFFIVKLGLRLAALVVGLLQADFLLSVGLFSAASAVMCAAVLVWYVAQVRRYDRSLAS